MKLTARQVAGIKAAARDRSGSVRAIARAYGVAPSTVQAIRAGRIHAAVRAATDGPRLETTPRGVDAGDVALLRKRGMTTRQIAAALGVSTRTVYRAVARR